MAQGKLVEGSIFETKTAAGHFAKGYRGKSFGRRGMPPGSVVVRKVGKYWGVFDLKPAVLGSYMSIEKGKAIGDRRYGKRR